MEYCFPEGFDWGCATASYQVEGSPLAECAGESIWHRFSHTADRIANNATGDIACDHYNRYKEDIGLMKQLGLNSYRFSIAWPRIFPEGRGRRNQAGIDFYDALIDELVGARIKPCLTLYHWDLPQAIQDEGGWQNPKTAVWFRDYAELLFDRFGDRVKMWITLNEPWVVSFIGHALGVHAPGIMDVDAMLKVGHTLLQAHGQAVKAFREGGHDGRIGITVDVEPVVPASESNNDKAAANRYHAFKNRWFLDPIFLGRYPEEMYEAFPVMPRMEAEDIESIHQPIDFVGINNYTRSVWKHDERAFLQATQIFPDGKYTETGSEVYPDAIHDILAWVHKSYGGPTLYITENGAPFEDVIESDGSINDDDRLDYLCEYLKACHRAIEEGVDLRGYYVWTLMDNFEWAFGYDKRIGIVYVDFHTQKRTVKKSGHWYSQVAKDNGFLD